MNKNLKAFLTRLENDQEYQESKRKLEEERQRLRNTGFYEPANYFGAIKDYGYDAATEIYRGRLYRETWLDLRGEIEYH